MDFLLFSNVFLFLHSICCSPPKKYTLAERCCFLGGLDYGKKCLQKLKSNSSKQNLIVNKLQYLIVKPYTNMKILNLEIWWKLVESFSIIDLEKSPTYHSHILAYTIQVAKLNHQNSLHDSQIQDNEPCVSQNKIKYNFVLLEIFASFITKC